MSNDDQNYTKPSEYGTMFAISGLSLTFNFGVGSKQHEAKDE